MNNWIRNPAAAAAGTYVPFAAVFPETFLAAFFFAAGFAAAFAASSIA